MRSLAGELLVATPPLADPNFDGTVVALLEHGPEGALGVVLNRPLDLRVAEALPGWEVLVAEPAVIFSGGPVGDGAGLCLGVAADGSIEILDLNVDPIGLDTAGRAMRIFLGFAGWGPGQLESELAQDAWIVVPADPWHDVVGRRPSSLWRDVLRRQRGQTAWLANSSPDPSLN